MLDLVMLRGTGLAMFLGCLVILINKLDFCRGLKTVWGFFSVMVFPADNTLFSLLEMSRLVPLALFFGDFMSAFKVFLRSASSWCFVMKSLHLARAIVILFYLVDDFDCSPLWDGWRTSTFLGGTFLVDDWCAWWIWSFIDFSFSTVAGGAL